MRQLCLAALALAFAAGCSPAGGSASTSGVCGGSQATCASVVDCCTGFECSLGKCLFVGGGNGGGNGDGSSGGSSGASSGSSSGGSSGASSTGTGSSGGTHGSGASGGSTGGAPSGHSPDLCGSCDSTGCLAATDLCVCDPSDPSCANFYCAGNCANPSTGLADPALCPSGTTCVQATDSETDNPDDVCLPSPGSCLLGGTSGGTGGTGGTSGGSSTGGGCTPDTWTNYVQALFANDCVSCHATYTSYTAVAIAAAQIAAELQEGTMPPNTPLDASDTARVLQWINCGKPE